MSMLDIVAVCVRCKRGYVGFRNHPAYDSDSGKPRNPHCLGCGGLIVKLDEPISQDKWKEPTAHQRDCNIREHEANPLKEPQP